MRKLKGIFTVITVITLVAALSVTSSAAKSFPDVPKSGKWYSQAVYEVAGLGWMNGYANGNFGPSDTIQRQDFVVLLANISGADISVYKYTQPFPDIKPNQYYSQSVAWAKYNGVLSGYSDGRFGLGDPITREQLCTILFNFVTNYLNIENDISEQQIDDALKKFPDVSNLSSWARLGMGWAVADGYVSGEEGKYLSPQGRAVRAQTAVIVSAAKSLLTDNSNAQTPVDPTLEFAESRVFLEGVNKTLDWHTGEGAIGSQGAGELNGISVRLENAPDSSAVCTAYFSGNGWSGEARDGARLYSEDAAIKAVSYELEGRVSEFYDLYYRCYCTGYGWLDWASNGERAGVSGVNSAVLSVEYRLVKKGDTAPGSTKAAYLSPEVNYTVTGRTYIAGAGFKDTTQGTVFGSNEDRLINTLALNAPEHTFSGISYRVYIKDNGFTPWSIDGAQAGTIGKTVEAVEIKTSGFIAEVYDIYYRVKVEHIGFSGWAKNGETAGSKGGGLGISRIDIRLVPKGSAAPGSSLNSYRSFDAVDRKAINVLNQVGWSLRSAFDWTVGFKYVTMTLDTSKGVNYFANYGFDNRSGNCYVYAACFYKMAKLLGYDAYWVCGHIQTRSGLQNHGWVEIVQNGDVRVYDPECMSKYPSINAYNFYYGKSGTWRYADHQRLA